MAGKQILGTRSAITHMEQKNKGEAGNNTIRHHEPQSSNYAIPFQMALELKALIFYFLVSKQYVPYGKVPQPPNALPDLGETDHSSRFCHEQDIQHLAPPVRRL